MHDKQSEGGRTAVADASEPSPGRTGAGETSGAPFDVESAVRSRYSGAAAAREASLCCPTTYDPRLLEPLPEEVIERAEEMGPACGAAGGSGCC